MADWTVADGVMLIAHTLFVFWQPFPMKRKEVKWYSDIKETLTGPWMLARVPAGVFPVVWLCLYICLVAGITVFSKSVNVDHWVWPTVYALYFANILISKMWTWLFFTKKQFVLALVNGIILALTAIAMVVCIGVAHDDIGDLYFVPLILFIVYATWLVFAIYLTVAWYVNVSVSETPMSLFREGVQSLTKDQLRMSRVLGPSHVPISFVESAKGK